MKYIIIAILAIAPQSAAALDVTGAGRVSDGSVTTAKIASGAVTTDKVGKDAVTGAGIISSAFTGSGITISKAGTGIFTFTGAPSVVVVSSAGIETTTNQSTFIACVGTVTVTTSGGPVFVGLSGGLDNSGLSMASVIYKWTILQDGAHLSGLSSTKGINVRQNTDASIAPVFDPIDFVRSVGSPSAASHSYCLAIANDSGRTLKLNNTNTVPLLWVAAF